MRLGEQNTTSDRDCSFVSGQEVCADPVTDVTIERIIKHKNYGENRFQNDIALLRLASPVKFSGMSRPGYDGVIPGPGGGPQRFLLAVRPARPHGASSRVPRCESRLRRLRA